MALQALYRRWRPQSFEEVIGQEHITRTLSNAVAQQRLAHAYLFSGPRGTGKTSVARILAKAVNCTGDGVKPCNACAMCQSITLGRSLDLIEIDAASNTGVDDVRDLREKIGFAPNEATYKVYVIDEVHMLSTAAFNALLKTLEEPPAHALFILATTEPHKIPDTILSRCQRHEFRRVGLRALTGKLAQICQAEGIEADEAALEAIARHATGSVRDAESLLDLLMAGGDSIDLAGVRAALGTPAAGAVDEIVASLLDADASSGLRALNEALDQGADPRQLRLMLLERLRALLLLQIGADERLLSADEATLAEWRTQARQLPPAQLASAIHRFNDARPSPDRSVPGLPLELALVETVMALAPAPANDGAAAAGGDRRPPTAPAQEVPTPLHEAPSDPGAAPALAGSGHGAGQEPPETTASRTLAIVESRWDEIMLALSRRDKTAAALLRDCRPVAADDASLTLGFFYQFHCQQVSTPERARNVVEAAQSVLGGPVALRCVVVEPTESERAQRPRSRAEEAGRDPVVKHAVEQLGGRIATVRPPTDED
jgi:DNA polymerase-3 subunit gamma/tau